MKEAYAETTWGKYSRAWDKFSAWCSENEIAEVKPCEPLTAALYFSFLQYNGAVRGAITSAAEGIKWAHDIAGLESPLEHPFVKKIFEGAKRICPAKSNKKDPIKVEYIRDFIESANLENLADLRFATMLTLSFAGLFRISELLRLKLQDLVFSDDSLKVTVRKSKNDKLQEGRTIYIARSGKNTCPVTLVETFLEKAGTSDPNAFVIAHLKRTAGGIWTGDSSKALSYSRARQILLEKTGPIREKFPEINLGTHSSRIGGASKASEMGIEERLLDEHGRWKSSKSKRTYLRDSKDKKLQLTKSLGI